MQGPLAAQQFLGMLLVAQAGMSHLRPAPARMGNTRWASGETKQRHSPALTPNLRYPWSWYCSTLHGCAETVPGAGMSVSSQELRGAPSPPRELLPLSQPSLGRSQQLWSDPPSSTQALSACKGVGLERILQPCSNLGCCCCCQGWGATPELPRQQQQPCRRSGPLSLPVQVT